MLPLKNFPKTCNKNTVEEKLFGRIADDIEKRGYSIQHGALPNDVASALYSYQQDLSDKRFSNAGVGRGEYFANKELVRTDRICWIYGESDADREWIEWATRLQRFLNQRLFLGLFSFESHFAHYSPGAYYKKHYDAFRGEANRILSVVAYLNPSWTSTDGGELVLYTNEYDREGLKVVPLLGTFVVFLSEQFAHEVLPASKDRHSVAGWFRVNTSTNNKIDPPQ